MTEDLGFIHRFVPSEDPSGSETLIVLHGTGGDENDLIGIGQAVAPSAAILSPRGNVLEAGAPRFFRRLAEGVFDPKEVHSRGEELARFIRAAVVTYRLDATRLFALGFSNGANIASTVMLIEHPERFGLSQLHQLRGRVGRGGEIKLCGLGKRLKDLFTMTKLIMVFDHHDGEDQAVAAFAV